MFLVEDNNNVIESPESVVAWFKLFLCELYLKRADDPVIHRLRKFLASK